MKRKKKPRWPDYELFDTSDHVTFGTSIFIRKDGQAIRILFPAGDSLEFAPTEDEKEILRANG